jgi:hypothetical protein
MKHIKLFEQYVNEGYSSSDMKKLKVFATQVSDEINDEYDVERFADIEEYSPEAMLDYIADWGQTNKMSAKEVIDEFDWTSLTQELGLEESVVNEYSRDNFIAKKIDRKDAVKPNILAKILFRASKTTEEAEQRIMSFNGTEMATHSVYYIVKPNGNRPDRPTYRIHVEQYYKWRPNEPKVNVSHVYILKLKEGSNAFTSQGDEWDVIGRAYVDTDMLTDDLNRTLEVLKRVS